MLLKNKNILITGAGKGIGESCVYSSIKNGGFVYALIKNKKDNYKFKKIPNLKIFNGDVRNEKLITKIFRESKKNKKPINCLINNAGIRFRKKIFLYKKKEIENVFNVNFFSIFYIMQIFSAFVQKNKIKGSLINISSIVGKLGFKELTGYASSKGGFNIFNTIFCNRNEQFWNKS